MCVDTHGSSRYSSSAVERSMPQLEDRFGNVRIFTRAPSREFYAYSSAFFTNLSKASDADTCIRTLIA